MSLFAKFNETNPVDAFIKSQYAKRGATAEQDGFDYWKKKIAGGMSLTDVQKGFDEAFANPELLAERQGITAAQNAFTQQQNVLEQEKAAALKAEKEAEREKAFKGYMDNMFDRMQRQTQTLVNGFSRAMPQVQPAGRPRPGGFGEPPNSNQNRAAKSWNTSANQSPVYKPRQGATNGLFNNSWGNSNPFKVRTF